MASDKELVKKIINNSYLPESSSIAQCEKLDPQSEYFDFSIDSLKKRLEDIDKPHKVNALVKKVHLNKLGLDDNDFSQEKLEKFVDGYQKAFYENKKWLFLRDEIYSLLLNYSIVSKNADLMKAVLEHDHYTNLFTVTNYINTNNLVTLLARHDPEIMDITRNYTKHFKGPKTDIEEEDKCGIVNSFLMVYEADIDDIREISGALLKDISFLEDIE